MSDSEISKMKVADLKRELKLRGLPTTGNKNELHERLQTALLGEGSLDESAIVGDDLLDDAVLSDEDETKILQADDDILKSPLPETPDDSEKAIIDDDILESPTVVTKKICLKRLSTGSLKIDEKEKEKSKENTEPTPPKVLKMSERNPISVSDLKKPESDSSGTAPKKVTELSAEERLALRAKKFGVTTPSSTPITTNKKINNKNQPIDTSSLSKVPDDKQIELLKKRAERFGCVTSSQIVKIENQERLLKRKERFNGATTNTTEDKVATTDNLDEKARKRLERFSKPVEASTNGTSTTESK